MPRYFFNYRTERGLVQDPTGHDHPDLDAAHQAAAEIGKAMLAKALDAGEAAMAPRCIEITDERGAEVLYVVFWASAKPVPDLKPDDELLEVPVIH